MEFYKIESWVNDFYKWQRKFLRKFPVPFIMRRHSHDCSRAVAGENVVRNPDGNLFAVDGIDGVSAGEHAGLFRGQFRAFEVAYARRVGAIGFDGGFGRGKPS